MNIAVLTPFRNQSIAMINMLLKENIHPKLVVFFERQTTHSQKSTFLRIRRMLRNILYFYRVDIRINRRKRLNKNHASREFSRFLLEKKLSTKIPSTLTYAHVSDVNGNAFSNMLLAANIDILFIWGVPLLGKRTIESVKKMIINAHTSLLPAYRGSQVEFWMVHNQDFEHAGITFHKVDEGVDTGEIILQVPAKKEDCINPEYLRMRNNIRVIECLPKVLSMVIKGDTSPSAQKSDDMSINRTYRFRDIQPSHLKKVYLS